MGFHQTKLDGPRSQDVGFGYFVTSLVNSLSKGETFAVWGGDQVNKIATPSLAAGSGPVSDASQSVEFINKVASEFAA